MNAPLKPDPWAELRRHTPARIALGRVGDSLPTEALLRFAAAHARARDAVHVPLDLHRLCQSLREAGWPPRVVASQAATREQYLRRPDLGRRLRPEDLHALRDAGADAEASGGPADLAVVLGDGLSALAVQGHGLAVLLSLRRALDTDGGEPLRWAPLAVATQARVALADEVGAALQARLVLMLLGERPGLSAADSLGAYLTFQPRVGRSDAERNCVSNIRPDGLPPLVAGQRLAWLVRQSLRRGLSGVGLKDLSVIDTLAP